MVFENERETCMCRNLEFSFSLYQDAWLDQFKPCWSTTHTHMYIFTILSKTKHAKVRSVCSPIQCIITVRSLSQIDWNR